MRVLIIEDEIRAAKQLEAMLTNMFPKIEVVDILDSVEESVAWLQQHLHPDLMILDIQLADGLSFEILQQVEVEVPIIFTTAYDQYSIRAFKVNSIDYLLKPIQEEDLRIAIEKYLKLNKRDSSKLDLLMVEKLINNLVTDKTRKRFVVKDGNSMSFVQVGDIQFFYSEDSISFLMTNTKKRYIVDMTLDTIEKDLNDHQFFRINRKQIVNINAIQRMHPYFNHRLKLDLSGHSQLEFIVSRKRLQSFKEWIT
ncbi:MAG: LytTR family DNA-binding domain-containing protein [Bacteroidota bacterium]